MKLILAIAAILFSTNVFAQGFSEKFYEFSYTTSFVTCGTSGNTSFCQSEVPSQGPAQSLRTKIDVQNGHEHGDMTLRKYHDGILYTYLLEIHDTDGNSDTRNLRLTITTDGNSSTPATKVYELEIVDFVELKGNSFTGETYVGTDASTEPAISFVDENPFCN